jgi:prepilin-type N-terminal cleavage/methylation domain-containing protein
MAPARRRAPNAFTLVELLVVIAIVAVLVAILLPVLAQARQRGEAIVCANNVRQIVLAMSTYEADNKSFPLLDHPCYGMVTSGTLPKCWVDALLEQHYLLGPDIRTRTLGVLACPAVQDTQRWIMPLPADIFSRSFTDYGYNMYVNNRQLNENKFYKHLSFFGQRGRMGRGQDKVLISETWYYGSLFDSTGFSMWSEGHGWFAATGGVSPTGPAWEARHMRGRAVTLAYMTGNVELVYPPPWLPEDATGRHPLSGWHFTYTDGGLDTPVQ